MANYFVKTRENGKVQGPFTSEQLKALAKQSKLKPEYLVSADQEKWLKVSSVKGLSLSNDPIPNHLSVSPEIANHTEQTTSPKGVIDDLEQVFQAFSQPVEKMNVTFGCLAFLVIVAGIITGFVYSWLLGILGGIGVVVVLVIISIAMDSPHKKLALERVSQLEEKYQLSRQELFDILLADKSWEETENKLRWHGFVTLVWDEDAWKSIEKLEAVTKPTDDIEHQEGGFESAPEEPDHSERDEITERNEASAGGKRCPECKSISLGSKTMNVEIRASRIATSMFGVVGKILLPKLVKQKEYHVCNSCGHLWEKENSSK